MFGGASSSAVREATRREGESRSGPNGNGKTPKNSQSPSRLTDLPSQRQRHGRGDGNAAAPNSAASRSAVECISPPRGRRTPPGQNVSNFVQLPCSLPSPFSLCTPPLLLPYPFSLVLSSILFSPRPSHYTFDVFLFPSSVSSASLVPYPVTAVVLPSLIPLPPITLSRTS